jgi:hypothetical protein
MRFAALKEISSAANLMIDPPGGKGPGSKRVVSGWVRG